MARTMKKAVLGTAPVSRAEEAAAGDNKKDGEKVAARPHVAGKTPRSTQGGKSTISAQRLALLRKSAPLGRLSQKGGGQPRRPRRKNHVLAEIRLQQGSTGFAIPCAAFSRLAREVTIDVAGVPFRFRKDALDAIQTASEAMLTELFAECQRQVFAQQKKKLLRRTFIFTRQTLRRLGWTCIDSGPLVAEIFDMGGGVLLQQIEGQQQIKAFKVARAEANRKKRNASSAAAKAAAGDDAK